MEFRDVVRRRRMVRNFESRPVPEDVLDRILDHARRAPSAGFTQGTEFLVLTGRDQTHAYWDITLPPERRDGFAWPGLLEAPVLILPLANRSAYLDRYAEPDKGWTDRDESRWPVPYWDVDAGFSALLVLLSAVDEGLGALFFGVFGGWDAVREHFGVPAEFQPVGGIALGYAAPDRPSPSLARGRRALSEVVHRGRW